MNKNNDRIDWVDIAKGIAIFLMVCGHTSVPQLINKFIYSFHMPLFFIVSGMLFNPIKYHFLGVYFKKMVKSLLVPYISFTIIIELFGLVNDVGIHWRINEGWDGAALWFLEALFFVELLMFLVINKFTQKRTLIFILLLFSLAGLCLYLLNIHLPYKLHVVFWGSSLYGLGYLLRYRLKNLNVGWLITLFFLLVMVVMSQLNPRIDMRSNYQGNYLFNNLGAIIGTLTIFMLSKNLKAGRVTSFFRFWGQNSLIVVCLSQILNYELKSAFALLPIPYGLSSSIRHFLLWVIMYYATVIIWKYVPFIIGK